MLARSHQLLRASSPTNRHRLHFHARLMGLVVVSVKNRSARRAGRERGFQVQPLADWSRSGQENWLQFPLTNQESIAPGWMGVLGKGAC